MLDCLFVQMSIAPPDFLLCRVNERIVSEVQNCNSRAAVPEPVSHSLIRLLLTDYFSFQFVPPVHSHVLFLTST